MTTRPHRSVSKLAASATLTALAVVLAILAAWAFQSYVMALSRAEERMTAASKIVASHAEWVHELGTQTLRRIDDALRDDRLAYDGGIRNIATAAKGLPTGVLAYVVDAEGRTLYSTDPDIKPVDITDRDYFQAVRDGQMEYMSSLLISRLSGAQIFVFSKRIERDGRFAGAIMVSVNADVMQPIWETVDLGGNYAVSFVRGDGMLVARYPRPQTTLDMSNYVLFTQYLKEASAGTYLAEASPLDGVKRLVAYRKVEGTPFIAIASSDYRVLIQPFWRTAQMLSLIAVVVVTGALAAGWWIRHLLQSEEQHAAQVAQLLEQNEMLLREIHHRVKNNLQSVMSLVRLQMRSTDGVEKLTGRIKAMIAVHEQIYKHDTYANIDAAQLIKSVVEGAVSAYEGKVTVGFDLASTAVSSDQATALAMLVNEVITNSLKYAYQPDQDGKLAVSLKKTDDPAVYQLIIQDHGKGFEAGSVKNGTGSRLIEGSVKQLNGTYSIDGSDGTCFAAYLPLGHT